MSVVCEPAPAVRAGSHAGLAVPLREALEHDRLLGSPRVLAALGDALVAAHPNGPAEPLAGGRRLPGLFRLMAHPVQRVQNMVRPHLLPHRKTLGVGGLSVARLLRSPDVARRAAAA